MDNERVLDGDILIKHFVPAYVSGTIEYSVDPTDTSIPDNDTLQTMVQEFVNDLKSGSELQYSDIKQYICRVTDPYDKYGTYVKDFELSAKVHNMDGSAIVVTGQHKLVIPTLDPFPKDTDKPISPRIGHWLGDDITLVRLT